MTAVIHRSLLVALARRPGLWIEAFRAAAAISRRGWWRRPPFLPRPDADYVAWRLFTAYGRTDVEVPPRDVVAYLEWRRDRRTRG